MNSDRLTVEVRAALRVRSERQGLRLVWHNAQAKSPDRRDGDAHNLSSQLAKC